MPTSTAGHILLDGANITALKPHERIRLGMPRTLQINQWFLDLTPLETIGLAISERLGSGGDWWQVVGSKSAATEEIVEIIERFRLVDVMHERTGQSQLLSRAVPPPLPLLSPVFFAGAC